MERAIIEALRLQTGQLSGYIAQSAKAVTGALDSQTKLQAQIAREVAETEAMRARRPSRSACEAVTGLTGLAATRVATERARASAAETESGRITGDRAVVDRPGAAAGDAARFETLTREYCNAARARARIPALCRGGDALHGADLRAGTPVRPPHLRERGRAACGRGALAQPGSARGARPAAPGLGRHRPGAPARAARPCGRRPRGAGRRLFCGSPRAPRPGRAARRLGRRDRAGRRARPPHAPVSRYELLELLASRRFENPDWFVSLQAMSQENLLRELAIMQAVSLMLDWRRFRTDERRGAIEAAALALATEEMRRLPGLANPAAGAN